jgi:hypothetical protein
MMQLKSGPNRHYRHHGPTKAGLCVAIFAALVFVEACASPTTPEVPMGAIRVNGTVHYFTLEGGFWAIQGDDGVTYDPMNGLAAAFQRENLRVVMVAKLRNDMGGIHMVGPIVEILSIQPQ